MYSYRREQEKKGEGAGGDREGKLLILLKRCVQVDWTLASELTWVGMEKTYDQMVLSFSPPFFPFRLL